MKWLSRAWNAASFLLGGGTLSLGLPWLAGIAGAALIAGAAASWWVQGLRLDNARSSSDLASAEAEIREAVRVNAQTNYALHQLRDRHVAEMAAIEKDRRGWANRAKRAETTIQEIIHADPKDNGPVAPVLRSTLDQLRVVPEGKGDDHRDADRARDGAGAAAPVRSLP